MSFAWTVILSVLRGALEPAKVAVAESVTVYADEGDGSDKEGSRSMASVTIVHPDLEHGHGTGADHAAQGQEACSTPQ